MAADLGTLRVSIDATQASATAKQLGQELTQMGQAGDKAATQVSGIGVKMSAGMQQATAQAAAVTGSLTQLQAIAAKMGVVTGAAGGTQGVTQLLQALEKARLYYEQLAKSAKETASLGGQQAVGYEEAARAAGTMVTALESTRQMVSEMVAEGEQMGVVYNTLKEQIGLLTPPLEGASAAAKDAFITIASGLEKSTELSDAFAESTTVVATGFEKEIAGAEKARQAAEAAAQKKAAAEEAAQAKMEAAEKKREAAAEAGYEKQAAAAEAMAKREEAAAEAANEKTLEMVKGIVSFATGMVGFSAMTEAVEKPMSLLKEAMTAGGEEEQFAIKLKNAAGAGVNVQDQLEQLKDFVTGPFGGALKLDDVVQGTRNLELLTGEAKITHEQLVALGATAQVSNQSFTAVANAYGRVVDSIKLGNPVRAQLLVQMQREGLIDQETVSQLEKMAKAHASAKSMLEVLDAGMAKNEETAKELSNSYEGLTARLSKLFEENILAPIGGAIESALKGPIQQLQTLFSTPEVKKGVKDFATNLEIELLTAINLVKSVGIQGTLEIEFQRVAKSMGDWFNSEWDKFVKDVQNSPIWQFFQKMFPQGTGTAAASGVDRSKITSANLPGGLLPTNLEVPPPYRGMYGMQTAPNQNWADVEQENTINVLKNTDKMTQLIEATEMQTAEAKLQKASADRAFAQVMRPTYPNTPEGQAAWEKQYNIPQLDAQVQAAKDQIKALQDEFNATKDQTTKTQTQTTETLKLNSTTTLLTTGITNLISAIQQLPNLMASDVENAIGTGGQQLFAGASRGLSEWAPGEARTQANQFGTVGQTAMGQLRLGDIALSTDKMIELFGSVNNAAGKFVDILDASGQKILEHMRIADTSYLSEGHPNVNTFEVWGRQWDRAGKVVAEGTEAAMDPLAKARADAEAQVRKQLQEEAAATGSRVAAPVTPIEKTSKTDLSESKELTDELTEATKKYGTAIELIEAQRKAHMITNAAAYQAELKQYQQEYTALDGIRAKYEAAEQAAQKANDPKLVEQYRMKLVQVETEMAKVKEKMDQISQTQTFGGQFVDELNKKLENLQFTGTKAADVLTQSLDQVGTSLGGIITGTTKASDAFKQMATAIANELWKIAWQILESQLIKLIQQIIPGLGSIGGVGGSSGGLVAAGHQSGGLISGPSGTDRVPSMLTAGEYVLTQRAVDKYGLAMIDAMNKGTYAVPKMAMALAMGGFVGAATTSYNVPPNMNPTPNASGQLINVVTNITVPGGTGGTAPAAGSPTGAGGLTKDQIAQFQNAVNLAVKQVIITEKRPGGLLSKQQLS